MTARAAHLIILVICFIKLAFRLTPTCFSHTLRTADNTFLSMCPDIYQHSYDRPDPSSIQPIADITNPGHPYLFRFSAFFNFRSPQPRPALAA
jgi:hypothetical protein